MGVPHSPENARSVPFLRVTSYCSGVSIARHSASLFVLRLVAIVVLVASSPRGGGAGILRYSAAFPAPPYTSTPLEPRADATLKSDAQVIGLVGFAHSLSHFFQLALPPLFPLIRAEFDVSWSLLGVPPSACSTSRRASRSSRPASPVDRFSTAACCFGGLRTARRRSAGGGRRARHRLALPGRGDHGRRQRRLPPGRFRDPERERRAPAARARVFGARHRRQPGLRRGTDSDVSAWRASSAGAARCWAAGVHGARGAGAS